ncbi:excalibur calcium-binding domain-containing protein [Planococcus sp. ISL-110]|uniref:excalibur calcium-binding domain-containing protein n=1 Tax=Planococcus sp. ISL-110 TaxID=2819167 RepID=UPI001BE8A647|nr:excalibur calcium-binding domain-containing protein [Planococcus sp. ISL-110]MBT2569698.1 excalibur calcium-binding domain-containing protein [Planococcus sp. ISL-110]
MKKKISGVIFGSFLVLSSTLNVGAVENDRDCGEFSSQEEVMAFWYDNGYSASNDPHDLDRDSDGLPCETSQSEYDSYVASQETDDSSKETVAEEEAATEEDETEEGAALPDTASNGPLMMLFGAGLAGAGSLLLFRRKNQNA